MRWISAWCAVVGVAMAGGCAAQERWNDFQDCGLVSMGVGWGLSGNVKLGGLGHLSAGVPTRTVRVGHESRQISGLWHEEEVPAAGWRSRLGHSPYVSYVRANRSRPRVPLTLEQGHWWNAAAPEFEGDFHQLDDIQAGLTLGVISVRLGINRLETLDFLLGFVGLDLAGDDAPPPPAGVPVGPIRYVLDDGTVITPGE